MAKQPTTTNYRPEMPRRTFDLPGTRRPERTSNTPDGKVLTVGREISLQGEITACEELIVEGRVEASLTQGRRLEVTDSGYFKGTVDIEEADISGRFEGKLTARRKLVVRSTGRIKGEIRYGTIEIEPGGQIVGDLDVLAEDRKSGS
ncbi:MAG: polymer-forming cytoskeletal protein [Acetobacterales bacterium]